MSFLRLRLLASVTLLGLALLAGGCQTRLPNEQIPKMKWLVAPFKQPPSMSETPRAIQGWWFGAKTIRENPRGGIMLAEITTRRLAELDYLNLISVIDLRYYFANKRQLLKDKLGDTYPGLDDKQIEQLVSKVPAIEYGKDLGVDKVLSGRILRQYMGENRTVHWWWSVLDVECQVSDVSTGKVEWTHHYVLRKQFASENYLQEELADRIVEDLRAQYFHRFAK